MCWWERTKSDIGNFVFEKRVDMLVEKKKRSWLFVYLMWISKWAMHLEYSSIIRKHLWLEKNVLPVAITQWNGHAFFRDSYFFFFVCSMKIQRGRPAFLMPKCKTFYVSPSQICLHRRLVRKQIECSGNKFLWTTLFLVFI